MFTKNDNTNILPMLCEGAEHISSIIGVTMGARGKNVIIAKGHDDPILTSDGVTVAKLMTFRRDLPGIAASIIRQSSVYVSVIAGDGTTAAVIMASSLVKHGAEAIIKEPYKRREIINGFNAVKREALKYIDDTAIKINDDVNSLINIATISVNSDKELGSIIGKAVYDIGYDSVIKVNKKSTSEFNVSFEKIKGYYIDKGYAIQAIPASKRGAKFDLGNPIVAYFTDDINAVSGDIETLVAFAVQNKRPMVILCMSIAPIVADQFAKLIDDRNINIIIIELKMSLEDMQEQIMDLITLSGSGMIINETTKGIDENSFSFFDSARITENQVIFTKEKTKDNNGILETHVIERIRFIEKQKEENPGKYWQNYYGSRIAKLKDGVGVINVSAPTSPELNAIVDLIDDGVKASQAALKEGIVVGGGKVFINLINHLSSITFSEDEILGVDIFMKALISPMAKILENAGFPDPENICKELSHDNIGYDVISFKKTDLLEDGIIDPASVVKAVLTASVSSAITLLSTGAIVYNEDYENTGLTVNREIYSN